MRFTATLELGGETATGIEVPEAVLPSRRSTVTVTVDGCTYRTTVARMGERYLVPLSAENRTAAGVAAEDEVTVDFELDVAPREVARPGSRDIEKTVSRCGRDGRRTERAVSARLVGRRRRRERRAVCRGEPGRGRWPWRRYPLRGPAPPPGSTPARSGVSDDGTQPAADLAAGYDLRVDPSAPHATRIGGAMDYAIAQLQRYGIDVRYRGIAVVPEDSAGYGQITVGETTDSEDTRVHRGVQSRAGRDHRRGDRPVLPGRRHREPRQRRRDHLLSADVEQRPGLRPLDCDA